MPATEFTIRRKVLTVFGAKFHIYNAHGALMGFCKQKAFKLKEDIRIYTDETMTEERLAILARAIIDISAAYDVLNSRENVKIGALRRQGVQSFVRDQWLVLDEQDREVGVIKEDSMTLALVRRFLSNLVPQKHRLRNRSGELLAEFRTHFNPFIHRMTVSVYPDCPLDPLMVLGTGVLLMAIEGRQG